MQRSDLPGLQKTGRERRSVLCRLRTFLAALDLPVFQLDRSVLRPKMVTLTRSLPRYGVDFFDDAALVLERAIGHFDGLAGGEGDARAV